MKIKRRLTSFWQFWKKQIPHFSIVVESMIEFHYTHNHTPKCSRYKKQRNSYTTHICNRSMFCPVLMYTFQEFWSKYLLTDLAFQTGILIKVLVLSWKRRWWRLICGLSKSHFAVSPSKSAARHRSQRGPMATAARAPRAVIRYRQSRCAPQFYRAFPFPLSPCRRRAVVSGASKPPTALWDILQSVSNWR